MAGACVEEDCNDDRILLWRGMIVGFVAGLLGFGY